MPPRARRWTSQALLLLVLAWSLALHAAIIFAGAEWPPRVTAIAAIAGLAIWLDSDRRPSTALACALLAVGTSSALWHFPEALLYVPPVVINAVLAAMFGATLAEGHEPVISRFARMEQGTLAPDLVRYTRMLTWIWTLLLATIALVAAALATWAPLPAWSFFANVLSYVLIGALFVGEYAYRRVRFRHYQHASLATLVRNVRASGPFGGP
jgi:uncharacterized membrane protein